MQLDYKNSRLLQAKWQHQSRHFFTYLCLRGPDGNVKHPTPTERKCSPCADTFSILSRYGFLDAFWHHYEPSIWLPSLFCKTTLNPNMQSPRENMHHQIVFLPLKQFKCLDTNETELVNRLEGKQRQILVSLQSKFNEMLNSMNEEEILLAASQS